MALHRSQFEEETAVLPLEGGGYETSVSSSWGIGDNPNGGYAQIAGIRAVGHLLDRPDPLTITTHFLRPALGDALGHLDVAEVRSGRRTATGTATLQQEGVERLRTVAAFGDLSRVSGSSNHEIAPPPVVVSPVEDCPSRIELEQGIDLPILSRVDVRIDPRWAQGPVEQAEVTGWVRFVDEGPIDSIALALFADAFPPSIFSRFGRIGWVPTLELTVHVRRRPVPGWIRGRFRTRDLTGGFLVEDGELWDASGALVAQSRQLAVFAAD